MKVKMFGIVILLLAAVFCRGQDVVITLDAFPRCIPADGESTSIITISATNSSGTPITDGTTVNLHSSLGTLSSSSVKTVKGKAIVELKSNKEGGISFVTATIGEVSEKIWIYFAKEPKNIVLVTAAPSIPADGESSIQVYAFVYDAPEGAVPDGTLVKFSTTLGNITPSSTTYGGRAVAILRSATTPGEAIVTAECGSYKTSGIVKFSPSIPRKIIVSTSDLYLPADGKRKAKIEARVYGDKDMLVGDGILVNFQTTEGTITPYSLTENGKAEAVLLPPTTPGKGVITAKCKDIEGKIEITFTGPPASLTLQAHPFATKLDSGEILLKIHATVRDKDDNPVGEGIDVKFSSSDGKITPIASTDFQGIAEASLVLPSTKESVKVSASVGTLIAQKDIKIANSPASIRLIAYSNSIPADGKSKTLLQCYVSGGKDEVLVGGDKVDFETDKGIIVPVHNGEIIEGVSKAFLISPTEHGIAHISARVSGASSTAVVTFSSNPSSAVLDYHPKQPKVGKTVFLLAAVLDREGNAVADGTPVSFSVKVGNETSILPSVTQNGRAVVKISPNKAGTYQVEISCESIKKSITFTVSEQ